jgi:hypothetical protein
MPVIPQTPRLMPSDPLFDSAWLKWGRAVVHTHALNADIETFGPDGGREPTFSVRAEYQPKRHGFAIIIDDIDALPPTWGLILGDVANNLRSALDQLAWALVTRGRTPPHALTTKQQRNVYYPISGTRQIFNAAITGNLPGVRRADIAKVRRYQPYHSGSKRRWFALTILSNINASDKHRTIQPIWAIPITAGIEITHQRDCVVPTRENRAKRKALQVNTELAFVAARKIGPQPHIEVKPLLTAEPAIDDRVLVQQWLKIAVWWIQWQLLEFSEPPDEIAMLGIDLDRHLKVMGWQRPDL